MIFLDYLELASAEQEENFFWDMKRTCYDTYYPFQLFPGMGLKRVDFSDITILYGGNGSGKSTILNILANKLKAVHDAVYNRSCFFEDYIKLCGLGFEDKSFKNKEMLTSDGVFDCMLDIRNLNQAIDNKREAKFEEYVHFKKLNDSNAQTDPKIQKELDKMRRNPLGNIDKYRRKIMSNTKSESQYIRRTMVDNVREQSNGESAFEYFVHKIDRDGIYILDEPENSLSPLKQLELVKFLEDSARYFNCQFVIATHSPFVLSIEGAKIYDLDSYPVTIRKWTELANVRAYYSFFKKHEEEFEKEIEVEQVSRFIDRMDQSPMRRALFEILKAYDIEEKAQNDIAFCLKDDKQIMNFLDGIAATVPAGLGKKALTDTLYKVAERTR